VKFSNVKFGLPLKWLATERLCTVLITDSQSRYSVIVFSFASIVT